MVYRDVTLLLLSIIAVSAARRQCVGTGAVDTYPTLNIYTHRVSATVYICMKNFWTEVCLNHRAGYVACLELGRLGSTQAYITTSGDFDNVKYQFWCYGNETHLRDCHYRETYQCHSDSTVIRCLDGAEKCRGSGTMRLSNENSTYNDYGRVEVCLNGIWSTICGADFQDSYGRILCRELGLPTENFGVVHGYQGGVGPIYHYMCNEYTYDYEDCSLLEAAYCTHLDDIGIWCYHDNVHIESCTEGTVALVGGNGDDMGRVEYCYQGQWYTVCADDFEVTGEEARVICQSLGHYYQSFPAIIQYSAEDNPSILPYNVECSTSDGTLSECISHQYNYQTQCQHVAGVICAAPCVSEGYTDCQDCGNCYSYQYHCSCSADCFNLGNCCPDISLNDNCYEKECSNGEVRLVGGETNTVGVLEVCYDEKWRTMCNFFEEWSNRTAKVVCRQLNLPSKDAQIMYDEKMLPNSNREAVIGEVKCTGKESELLICSHLSIGQYNCSYYHAKPVAIKCSSGVESVCKDGEVRLEGGEDSASGYVEFCQNGTWSRVCSEEWGMSITGVVCRQLNFNREDAREIGRSNTSWKGPVFGLVGCSGSEQSLDQCTLSQKTTVRNCVHVKISCETIQGSSTLPQASNAVTKSSSAVTTGLSIGLVGMLVILVITVSLYVIYGYYAKRATSTPPNHVSPITPDTNSIEMMPAATEENIIYSNMWEEELERGASLMVKSDDIKLMDCIGKGGFGVVYKARFLTRLVAVKIIKVEIEQETLDNFERKAMYMGTLKHSNILEITGICMDTGSTPYIFTPFMANGNLLKYLRRKRQDFIVHECDRGDDEATRRLVGICSQIVSGMEYLTSKNITHGNLAASNCIIDFNFIIKITDYGINQCVFNMEESRSKKNVHFMWMAPESLDNHVLSEKSDMWSFGVTMWEIFSGGDIPSYPETTCHGMLLSLRQGHRLPRPYNTACTDIIHGIMKGCWKLLPEERKSFSEMSHVFSEYFDHVARYVPIGFNPLKF